MMFPAMVRPPGSTLAGTATWLQVPRDQRSTMAGACPAAAGKVSPASHASLALTASTLVISLTPLAVLKTLDRCQDGEEAAEAAANGTETALAASAAATAATRQLPTLHRAICAPRSDIYR